jgi:hypothetical protein
MLSAQCTDAVVNQVTPALFARYPTAAHYARSTPEALGRQIKRVGLWRGTGSCGPEPQIAGASAHPGLGLAAGILRHLPADLLYVIAAAHGHDPKVICGWLEAASIIADGRTMTCPTRQTVEAFIHFSQSQPALTSLTWSSYVARAPKGWARYDALMQDGNDVLLFSRSP